MELPAMGRFRPRITVRWLMVSVAAISLAMGVAVMLQRRSEYLRMAGRWREVAAAAKDDLEGRGVGSALGVEPEASRVLYLYYDRLRRKYEFAADHPWRSVDPDPPNPYPAPVPTPAVFR
jgi:hypothetical protein